jgi:hypothetical protein
MGPLPRVCKVALGVLVLFALISLPSLRDHRTLGSALAPSVAWAGGSPDETLNPPPTPPPPPKKASRFGLGTVQVGVTAHRPVTKFTALERWEIFYRVFRIFAHRI